MFDLESFILLFFLIIWLFKAGWFVLKIHTEDILYQNALLGYHLAYLQDVYLYFSDNLHQKIIIKVFHMMVWDINIVLRMHDEDRVNLISKICDTSIGTLFPRNHIHYQVISEVISKQNLISNIYISAIQLYLLGNKQLNLLIGYMDVVVSFSIFELELFVFVNFCSLIVYQTKEVIWWGRILSHN